MPVPVLPLEPLVLVVLGLDVLPPHETSPAANTTVSVITAKPRRRTAALVFWRRPQAKIAIIINPSTATAAPANAMGLFCGGEVCDEGADIMLVVGVDARVIVSISVAFGEALSGFGLNVQVNHAGRAAPVSAFRQEKLIEPEKPLTVTVKFADGVDADKFALAGDTEPVGKVAVAKSMSAAALALG